jgi:hypothetical protein
MSSDSTYQAQSSVPPNGTTVHSTIAANTVATGAIINGILNEVRPPAPTSTPDAVTHSANVALSASNKFEMSSDSTYQAQSSVPPNGTTVNSTIAANTVATDTIINGILNKVRPPAPTSTPTDVTHSANATTSPCSQFGVSSDNTYQAQSNLQKHF